MEKRARILIVDDDELVGRVLERILGPDYDVTVTSKGEDAIGMLTDGERFDVILSDFTMPRVDGARLVELIAQLDRAQADRVIFITSNALAAIVHTERLHAIVDKPFSPTKVREMVERVAAAASLGYFPPTDDDDGERHN